jgi:ferric-dicitrate binding protein FerR (iron transport regulator)
MRNEDEYKIKEYLYKQLDRMSGAINDTEVLDDLLRRIWLEIRWKEKRANSRMSVQWLSVAAVIIILLGISLYPVLVNKQADSDQLIRFSAVDGSQAKTILPDGTMVYLNANSTLSYKLSEWKKSRGVRLQGEAWFEVEKSENKTFQVHTNEYTIEVLGTKFNVSAYDSLSQVVTTLAEGAVGIRKQVSNGFSTLAVLEPGEQFVYDKVTGKYALKSVRPFDYNLWYKRKLIFSNSNFGEVVTKFEQRYGVSIEVVHPELLHLHFDGTFVDEKLEEALDIIQLTMPVEYMIQNDTIVITKK